jgi:hypothetical protein
MIIAFWWLLAGSADLHWQPPVDIASGGGTKGPWQQNESHFDYVDDPSVALDSAGDAHVVWVDHRDKDVHFQILAPDGHPLQRPQNISHTPAVFSWLPRIALDGKNTYVLWQEIVFSGGSHGGEILFARSTDDGRTFKTPINLSRSIPGDGKGRIDRETWDNGSFDLIVAPDGSLYAAWTEFDGPLWFSSSHDRGASFSAPMRVAGTYKHPTRAPSLAAAPDGDVYLAWTYGEDRGADIRVARRHDGAPFTTPTVVHATSTYSDAPSLAVDGKGVLHLAYTETAGGPHDRPSIHYARSTDHAGSFETPRTLADDAAFPSLVADGTDVFVTAEHMTPDGARGLVLTATEDGGKHFAPAKAVPHSIDERGGTNGSQQGKLTRKLAVQPHVLAIVNSSLARGRGSRVWLMRATR